MANDIDDIIQSSVCIVFVLINNLISGPQPAKPALAAKKFQNCLFGEKRCMTSTEPADAKNNDISSRNLDHTAAYTKLTQRWKMLSIEM